MQAYKANHFSHRESGLPGGASKTHYTYRDAQYVQTIQEIALTHRPQRGGHHVRCASIGNHMWCTCVSLNALYGKPAGQAVLRKMLSK